jgi:hypothetical protein
MEIFWSTHDTMKGTCAKGWKRIVMRSAEVITVGVEGKLQDRLREMCLERGWWLRPVTPEGCLSLLRQGSCGVLVLRLGRHHAEALALLNEAARNYSRVRRVVLSEPNHPQLEGLAWDTGAEAVLSLPQGVVDLLDLIPRFMGG